MKKESKGSMNSFRRNQLIFIWTLIIIPIIGWFIFFLYVNASSFAQAFMDFDGNFTFANFEETFKSFRGEIDGNGGLGTAIKNTLSYFSLSTFVIFPIQTVMAYFLYKQIPGYKLFRIVFYLPAIVSSVAMTGVFKEVISSTGPMGVLADKLGFDIPRGGYLGNIETATKTVLVYCFWSGLVTPLLTCGAMAKIPIEVLESARIDGVQAGRELINIVIPLIWPTLSTLLILNCTGFIGASGPILLMVKDPYTNGATTVSYWIWEKVYQGGGFMKGKYSLVSAAGLTFTLFVVPIVLLLRKLIEKIPTVEY